MSRKDISHLIDMRAKVRLAISEIMTAGQSMSLDDGISYTRSSLRQLHQYERMINGQISRASGANPMFQGVRMG
jgi:hypothetical protein